MDGNAVTAELRTGDIDEMRERVTRLFCAFSLTARASRYEAYLCHRRLGAIGLTEIAYDQAIDIEVPPALPVAMLQLAERGSFLARSGGNEVLIGRDRLQVMTSPAPLAMSCPGATRFFITSFDRAELTATSRVLGGADEADEPPALPGMLSMTGAGASLGRYLRFLRGEAERPDSLMRSGRGARQAQQTLIALLLAAAEPSEAPAAVRGRPWYVKRAEEFMEANLAEDIGIADVVAGSGVCMRTLHHGFRAVHHETPMTWLKHRRLERIRAELLRAEPGGASVAAIALSWGIVHLGRFAADYRARFGETPSATLRDR